MCQGVSLRFFQLYGFRDNRRNQETRLFFSTIQFSAIQKSLLADLVRRSAPAMHGTRMGRGSSNGTILAHERLDSQQQAHGIAFSAHRLDGFHPV